jgi:hypothetical protein
MFESEVGGPREISDEATCVHGIANRTFGFTFSCILLVIALYPLSGGSSVRWWAVSIAGALFLLALARPAYLEALKHIWLRFAGYAQRITTLLIFALLFFGLVTPIAIAIRRMKWDLLRLDMHSGASSYWTVRQTDLASGDMKRQY